MLDRFKKNRRDPDWEVDGPAARREQRQRRIRGGIAFSTALGAVAFAAFAWSIKLGFTALIGIRIALPIG